MLMSMAKINIITSRLQRLKDKLNSAKRNLLHDTAGQLNLPATQSRPVISYDTLEMTLSIKNAVMDNLKQANKVVK